MDEYVSDTESVYSIINYEDPNETEEVDSDLEDDDLINNLLKFCRKYKSKQLDDIEKLNQIASMLTYLR